MYNIIQAIATLKKSNPQKLSKF